MSQLSQRLEIASRVVAAQISCRDYMNDLVRISGVKSREEGRQVVVNMAIDYTDRLIAADSHSGTDTTEMARTIQRLEQRLSWLRGQVKLMADHANTQMSKREYDREVIYEFEVIRNCLLSYLALDGEDEP